MRLTKNIKLKKNRKYLVAAMHPFPILLTCKNPKQGNRSKLRTSFYNTFHRLRKMANEQQDITDKQMAYNNCFCRISDASFHHATCLQEFKKIQYSIPLLSDTACCHHQINMEHTELKSTGYVNTLLWTAWLLLAHFLDNDPHSGYH